MLSIMLLPAPPAPEPAAAGPHHHSAHSPTWRPALRHAGAQRSQPPPFLTVPLPAWLIHPGGRSYFGMEGPEFSSDEQLMAYAVDLEGSEVYTL